MVEWENQSVGGASEAGGASGTRGASGASGAGGAKALPPAPGAFWPRGNQDRLALAPERPTGLGQAPSASPRARRHAFLATLASISTGLDNRHTSLRVPNPEWPDLSQAVAFEIHMSNGTISPRRISAASPDDTSSVLFSLLDLPPRERGRGTCHRDPPPPRAIVMPGGYAAHSPEISSSLLPPWGTRRTSQAQHSTTPGKTGSGFATKNPLTQARATTSLPA
jgi:hypothetical protein